MRLIRCICVVLIWLQAGILFAQQPYQKPPKEILDVLNAPLPPSVYISPTRDTLVFAQPVIYPPISDLSEPMLPLAGLRVVPRINSEPYNNYISSLSLKKLPDGAEVPLALPAGAHLGRPRWNADGTMFAFYNTVADGIEVWVADVVTQKVRPLRGLRFNPLLGYAVQWLPDQKNLLVKLIPAGRGAPPEAPRVPLGPKIQESSNVSVASSTYEARDVLKSPHDADLFDYYAASQLALVNAVSGELTLIGKPAIYDQVSPSPDNKYLFVERIQRPYSYLCAYNRFPREFEIWNLRGEPVEKVANRPLADQVPIHGVVKGPRSFAWCPIKPSTLTWVEALDEGDPDKKVPYRDRFMIKPVLGKAVELWKSEKHFGGLQWIEKSDFVLATDQDENWNRTFLINAEYTASYARMLWCLRPGERYKHPGYPVYHTLPTGFSVILNQGNHIYLSGQGSTPEGNRPFLDRLDLKTLKTERLFRSDPAYYEYFIAWINPTDGTFITRRESPTEHPNFYIRTLDKEPIPNASYGEASWASGLTAVTHFSNPTPQLRGITKRLVTYKREDGLSLSFTLYLPPGYKQGTPLPTVLYAYPLDYIDERVAQQVGDSSNRFMYILGPSELFFLLQGYAVLEDVAMPVVGPSKTRYDTFIEQIVANAKAAINKAVELGVTDPERVGVMGHSHGALMTANLLAHSDLFRAGIARSGAYNKTLGPFGFQSETRTLYQAKDTYLKLSPTLFADKIDKPLLLIHGEQDQNPGTVPLQSEKLYEAVRGVGGTVRLVMLPFESHGYEAKESVEHVLCEMLAWFDRYVKNAQPRKLKP